MPVASTARLSQPTFESTWYPFAAPSLDLVSECFARTQLLRLVLVRVLDLVSDACLLAIVRDPRVDVRPLPNNVISNQFPLQLVLHLRVIVLQGRGFTMSTRASPSLLRSSNLLGPYHVVTAALCFSFTCLFHFMILKFSCSFVVCLFISAHCCSKFPTKWSQHVTDCYYNHLAY